MSIKTLFRDFAIGRRHTRLLPRPHNKECNMIVRKKAEICIDAKQLGCAVESDASFFGQFPAERRGHGLGLFDAAAGEVPSGPVGVADQQHAVVGREHHALRAERKAARQPPVALDRFGYELFCWHGLVSHIEA